MKKILFTALFFIFCFSNLAFGEGLRDYDGVEVPKGTLIPVINTEEISTVYYDVNSKVKFISTTDLYLYEMTIIPEKTEFYGYIEKINEPVVGTNAALMIKITKLRLADGFEIPLRGYIYSSNANLIGGELTAPASYDKKPSNRQGFKPMVGYVPGEARKMGDQKVIKSGSDLQIVLTGPLYITHTVGE